MLSSKNFTWSILEYFVPIVSCNEGLISQNCITKKQFEKSYISLS